MGYYATLTGYKIDDARINPVEKKEFLERVEEECKFGFAPDNFKIEIDNEGNIKDFEIKEWGTKWYDEEDFEKILSEYLKEGNIYFEFRGEDGYSWSSITFPKLTLDGNWIEYSADRIISIVNYPNFLLTQISQSFLLQRLHLGTPPQALRAVPSLITLFLVYFYLHLYLCRE